MVIAGDGSTAADYFTQRRGLVYFKIMKAVSVVADCVVHVLNKITTERDIDELGAPADRQQREMIIKCSARKGNIKCILFFIDSVLARVRLLAGPPSCDIPTAGQQHTVGKPDPLLRSVDVNLQGWRVRMNAQRLSTGREDRLDQGLRVHLGFVAERRGPR
jgi:hypothetical protein